MSDIQYSLVNDKNGKSLTVIYSDGETNTVPGTHPYFDEILGHLLDEVADEQWLKDKLDLVAAAGSRLLPLSERVRVAGNSLLFDGDHIDGAVADHILRLLDAQDEAGYKPLVNFLEKVKTNPSVESVESLYSWLKDREFTIAPDGDFIAYKGVKVNSEGESLSIHSGKAFVNGVVHVGYIPNPDGGVIEMPRAQVDANVAQGCSTGLHAGTWSYASSFGQGRTLTVKINPRDVVSVPRDSEFQKLRVSRYTVLSSTDQEFVGTTYAHSDYGDDDYEDEYDDDDWGDHEDYDF